MDAGALEQAFVSAGVPADLAKEVTHAFTEAKRRFHRNDYRPHAVEGGRFSEAVLRVLQWQAFGKYDPLGDSKFKADSVIRALEQAPTASAPDSVRLHIPRSIRLIYDIRNKRNTAHLSDGIDPNVQDANLVVNTMSWILAELVRLHHSVDAPTAQRIIDNLVQRELPLIFEVDGFPRVLRTIGATDHCLVLLYWVGGGGTTRQQLSAWLPEPMRKNLTRTLRGLHGNHRAHFADPRVTILPPGMRYVEESGLLEPA